jgi:hypothetical protein
MKLGALMVSKRHIMDTDIDWTGIWETNYGKVELYQTGNIVNGSYGIKQGKIEGVVLGDGLSGKWSEAPSYAPPNDAGEFVIHMDQSGSSFEGMWWKLAPLIEKEWNGSRV